VVRENPENPRYLDSFSKFPRTSSTQIKKAMDQRKTLTENINEMGLVFDVNKTMKIPNSRAERVRVAKKLANGFVEEDQSDVEDEGEDETNCEKFPKQHVVDTLEKESKEFRESRFRLPKGQIKFVSYLIDKYGLNYKKMAKDIKNYDQETWRQLRAKCRKFMSITDHFSKYLEERDLVDTEIDPEDPKWKETNTDIEDD
jgi:hypothetical protein